MDDTLNKEQVIEQPTKQPMTEQESKIFLNDKGEIEGDLGWEVADEPEQTEAKDIPDITESGEGEEENSEEEAQEEATATEQEAEDNTTVEPENKYYTLDEIKELGIDKLDPKKIPEELVPFYKSMQADYTRKTQKVADIKKKALELVKQVAVKPLQSLPTYVAQAILQQADSLAKEKLGEDVDEFDSNYLALKSLYAQDLATNYQNQVRVEQALQTAEQMLRATEPNYPAIEQLAIQALANMPHEKVMEIQQAKATGNIEPLLELFETAREMFYAGYKPQVQQQQQTDTLIQKPKQQARKQVIPPVVEGSGTGEIEPKKPKIKANDLQFKSTEEQAKMLIEMGLI
jgi:hypothetical protein